MSTTLHQCGSCNVTFKMEDFHHLIAAAPNTRPTGILQKMKDTFFALASLSTSPPDVHPDSLVFTCCKSTETIAIHVFYKTCLSNWVNQSQQNCPTCRAPIYKNQLGKTVTQLLDIFLKALQFNQKVVIENLQSSDEQTGECSICTNDLPIIPLRYDPSSRQLFHDECGANHSQLYISDLTRIASTVINNDPTLKKLYTPVPPTFLEKIL